MANLEKSLEGNSMVNNRRRKKRLVRAVTTPLAVGVFGTTTLIAGQATQSLLPVGTVNPLTQIGTSASQFAGPIGTIGLAGVAVRQVRDIKPRRKRRRRR